MSAATNPCPICDHPIADTAYVCHRCARSLATQLLRAARLWRDLEDSLAGLGHVSARQSPPKPDLTVLIGPRCADYSCDHETCYAIARSVSRAQARWRDEPPLAHEDRGPLRLGDIAAKDDAGNTITTWAQHIAECRGEEIPAAATARLLLDAPPQHLADDADVARCPYSDLPMLPVPMCACGHH